MTAAEWQKLWEEWRWYRLAGKLVRLVRFPDGTFYRKPGQSVRRGLPQPVTVCFWCQEFLHEGHGPDAMCPACEQSAAESARFFGD